MANFEEEVLAMNRCRRSTCFHGLVPEKDPVDTVN
jgi:hypothetical protein